MKKVFTCLFVVVLFLTTICLSSCTSDDYSKGLSYVLINNDTEYEITSIGEASDTEIVLPEFHDGLKVTSIGEEAFSNCSQITSMIISTTISTIYSNAFIGCDSLLSIVIPENVTAIRGTIFVSMNNDFVINCEAAEQPIAWSTSWQLNEYKVNFGYNNKTTNSEYDYIVKNNEAFLTNYKLSDVEVIVPSNIDGYDVVSIGSTFDSNDFIKSIDITSGVKSIYPYGLYDCSSIEEIIISNSVESIGDYAFANCIKLSNLTFGSSIKSVGGMCFINCSMISNFYYAGDISSWLNIDFSNFNSNPMCLSNNMYMKNSDDIYEILTNIVIPDGTKQIKNYAFSNNISTSTIISVSIPDSVESIGDSAFSGCNKLESLVIPDSVVTIGISAFDFCKSLKTVTIGVGVNKIGASAFFGCESLESITFKDSSTWCSTYNQNYESGNVIDVVTASKNVLYFINDFETYFYKE